MNFVLTLSLSVESLDCMLTTTYKFSKRVIVISERANHSVEEWAHLVLNCLQTVDWEILVAIIMNENSKFMRKFWRETFRKLDTSLLISIVYYLQTNEQFKRINQTVKIALTFLLSSTNKSKWFSLLSVLQVNLNNSRFASTSFSLNEILYDFRTREVSDLLLLEDNKDLDWVIKRSIFRSEVADVILFAVVKFKL